MAHRGFGRERGVWWKLGRDLLFAAVFLGSATAVFILGDLAIYGHVNW
jgi:hypothetical protein